MTFDNLLLESQAGVSRITFNRPKVLNALNRATLLELECVLEGLAKDAATRVVILTGAGEKAFVAGADIAEMSSLRPTEAAEFSRLGHRVLARLEALEVPVIAEVNGFALGGGCELMLACDFAIASENARFGQPEVKLGVIPGFGGTIRLARRVGAARARQLLFTGETLLAKDAERIGLVSEVVPADRLRARVDELAQVIARNAPKAVAWSKRASHVAEDIDLASAATLEQELFGMCFSTDDQREGMRAFQEKRVPTWAGR